MTSSSPSLAVSRYLIKPQATFLSLLAPSRQHPWSLRTKENSTETKPPHHPQQGDVSFFVRTGDEIQIGIFTWEFNRDPSSGKFQIDSQKHICVLFCFSKEVERKQSYCFMRSDFPFLVVGGVPTSPPGIGSICVMPVLNPNFSPTCLKRDLKGETYSSIRKEPSMQRPVVTLKSRNVSTVFIDEYNKTKRNTQTHHSSQGGEKCSEPSTGSCLIWSESPQWKSPQWGWEDLPDLTLQSSPFPPLATSYLTFNPQLPPPPPYRSQEQALAPGHLITPFPRPLSVFLQKSAWLTGSSWPTLRLPRFHLIRGNFPDHEIKMAVPGPSLRSWAPHTRAYCCTPHTCNGSRRGCFLNGNFTISWKGHLPKCASTFHLRARCGQELPKCSILIYSRPALHKSNQWIII